MQFLLAYQTRLVYFFQFIVYKRFLTFYFANDTIPILKNVLRRISERIRLDKVNIFLISPT